MLLGYWKNVLTDEYYYILSVINCIFLLYLFPLNPLLTIIIGRFESIVQNESSNKIIRDMYRKSNSQQTNKF